MDEEPHARGCGGHGTKPKARFGLGLRLGLGLGNRLSMMRTQAHAARYTYVLIGMGIVAWGGPWVRA